MEKKLPNLSFEKKLWEKGYFVIGVDEVGRGSFAGPLVVGAVCFESNLSKNKQAHLETLGINDSKKLTEKKREHLTRVIEKEALALAIATVHTSTINKKGIANVTRIAIRKAVSGIQKQLHHQKLFVLADAFYTKYVRGVGLANQKAIVHGDEISLSIAAASIIAKVHRDNLMVTLSQQYPLYHFEKNKGYGTADHIKALQKYGKTRIHRNVFVKNVLNSRN